MSTIIDERQGLPSASQINQLINCPASFIHELDAKRPQTESAARGERIHQALAEEISVDELSADEKITYECIKTQLDKLLTKLEWKNDKLRFIREKRLWLKDPETEEPLISGKPDIVFYNETLQEALVVDYKTSHYAEPAMFNWQLRTLAVLVEENYCLFNGYMAIITPDSFDYVYYNGADINGWRNTLYNLCEEIKNMIRDTDCMPIYTRAGDHCKWCSAAGQCAVFANYVDATTSLIKTEGANFNSILEKAESKTEYLETFKLWLNRQWNNSNVSINYKIKFILRMKLVTEMYDLLMQQVKDKLVNNPDYFKGLITLEKGAQTSKAKDYSKIKEYFVSHNLMTAEEFEKVSEVSLNKLLLSYVNKQRESQGLKPLKSLPSREKEQMLQELLANDLVEIKENEPRVKIQTK